jgi:hypothetical protein
MGRGRTDENDLNELNTLKESLFKQTNELGGERIENWDAMSPDEKMKWVNTLQATVGDFEYWADKYKFGNKADTWYDFTQQSCDRLIRVLENGDNGIQGLEHSSAAYCWDYASKLAFAIDDWIEDRAVDNRLPPHLRSISYRSAYSAGYEAGLRSLGLA